MSWSVNLIGHVPGVINELEKVSKELKDLSKEEFDSAFPHLVALVSQNFVTGQPGPIIFLGASGHGYKDANNIMVNNQVCVELKINYAKLVL